MDVYDVKLSKGYQFTLQAKSRRKHGLRPGQEIRVIDLDKEIILRPKRKGSLKNLVGKFKVGKKFDAVEEHDLIVSGFD
ncbi:MAG: AbrB/MazE/SpoVT family DNA-binding domain-containing protein [archaeon]